MLKANKIICRLIIMLLLVFGLLLGCNNDNNSDIYVPAMLVPVMVDVPSGTFSMGFGDSSNSSGPAHDVTLSGYAIGKYEISNTEYASMLNYALAMGYLAGDYPNNITVKNRDGDSQELLDLDGYYEGKGCQIYFSGGKFVIEQGMEKRPVRYVSWYGAAFYTNILNESEGLASYYDLTDWKLNFTGGLGFRIPTEAEWEGAARYADGRPAPWRVYDPNESEADMWAGLTADMDSGTYANFNGNVGDTTDVDSYDAGASVLGIYNLVGNVSEWCQDYYAQYNDEAQTDPVNDTSGVYRQRRGGGWLYYANNFYWTTYHTDTNYGYVSYPDLGFRVVKAATVLQPIVIN